MTARKLLARNHRLEAGPSGGRSDCAGVLGNEEISAEALTTGVGSSTATVSDPDQEFDRRRVALDVRNVQNWIARAVDVIRW